MLVITVESTSEWAGEVGVPQAQISMKSKRDLDGVDEPDWCCVLRYAAAVSFRTTTGISRPWAFFA
jgi:hypothetical protein